MLSAVFPLPSAWNGQVAASPVPRKRSLRRMPSLRIQEAQHGQGWHRNTSAPRPTSRPRERQSLMASSSPTGRPSTTSSATSASASSRWKTRRKNFVFVMRLLCHSLFPSSDIQIQTAENSLCFQPPQPPRKDGSSPGRGCIQGQDRRYWRLPPACVLL